MASLNKSVRVFFQVAILTVVLVLAAGCGGDKWCCEDYAKECGKSAAGCESCLGSDLYASGAGDCRAVACSVEVGACYQPGCSDWQKCVHNYLGKAMPSSCK